MIPVGIPTGFIMRSPSGAALMFLFDKMGNPDPGSGQEMPMQEWLLEYGTVMPEDALLLVEHFDAEGRRLMKCLDSGLLRDGSRKVPVGELAVTGRLWDVAKQFRDEYLRRMF